MDKIISAEEILNIMFSRISEVFAITSPQLTEMAIDKIVADIVGVIVILFLSAFGIKLTNKAKDLIFGILGL